MLHIKVVRSRSITVATLVLGREMKSYLAIDSVDELEFDSKKTDLSNSKDATQSDAADVERIENLLDLAKGALSNKKFFISKGECSCGRTITFYDFVFTALVEQWHDPSFVAHTLLGNKRILNQPRTIRCSGCGSRGARYMDYETPQYGCCKEIAA